MITRLRGTWIFLFGVLVGVALSGIAVFAFMSIDDRQAREVFEKSADTVGAENAHTDVATPPLADRSEDAVSTVDPQPPETPTETDSEEEAFVDQYEDAASAWDALIAEFAGNLRLIRGEKYRLLIELATARQEEEGLNGIHAVGNSLLEDDYLWRSVLGSVLDKIVDTDPNYAFDAAISLRPDDKNDRLSWGVVNDWAEFDPRAAFARVLSIDFDTGLRERLLSLAMDRWAYKDPLEMLGNIDRVPKELVNRGVEEVFSRLAKRSPGDAAVHVGAIQDASGKQVAVKEIVDVWLKRDVTRAISWIRSSQELEGFRQEVLGRALKDIARTDPSKAVDLALEQPIQKSEIGLEANVIRNVSYYDIDEAMSLLPKVRLGATKVEVCDALAASLIGHGKVERALDLARELPEESRDRHHQRVVSLWARTKPVEVAEKIDKLPLGERKPRVAFNALIGDHLDLDLSNEQREKLKSKLTPEMLEEYEEFERKRNVSE